MALILPNDPSLGRDYDQEADDRDESYIEKLVQDFTDEEELIRHDVYLESDDEADARGASSVRLRTPITRGDESMYKGQKFYNGSDFKECVTDYALTTGCNLKQYKYDRDAIGFKCVVAKGKCGWQVYVASLGNDYGICGVADHNCRFHQKKKATHATQSEPSQGEPSQGSLTQQ